MSIRDDEQFERYLKQFRPVAPEPLAADKPVLDRRSPLVFAAWAAVAAAILVGLVLSLRLGKPAPPAGEVTKSRPGVEQLSNPQPLTIASANALLAKAPSFKAAVDGMAFRSESKPISQGKHSALAVLSKEEEKL